MSVPVHARTYKCRSCYKTNDFWDQNCPSCNAFGGLYLPEHGAPPPRRHGPPTLADAKAVRGTRVPTGIFELDRIFGTDWKTSDSGIRVPSIELLAGGEGTGKTTLMLQMLATCKESSILLTTEQTIEAIRDTAERIGLTDAQLGRVQAEAVDTLEQVLDLLRARKPRIVVLDSISDLTDPERDTGDSYANTIRMLQTLKKDAEKHRRGVICMVQLNNDDVIAGLRKMRHKVDAVMRFTAYGHELRLLECPDKNRYGQIGVRSWFTMTVKGLVPCDEPAEDPSKK